MRSKPFILALFIIMFLVTIGSAISIELADTSLTGVQDVEVYYINGTHMGSYNTTSQFDTNESVIIHIAPAQSDYLRNPDALLDETMDFVSDNALPIAAVCLLIGLLVVRR